MRGPLVLLVVLYPATAGAFDRHHQAHDLPRAIGDRDPSERAQRVPRAAYQSVTAAIKTYRPVEPLPWDELNRRVTPRPKEEPRPAPPKQN